MSRKMKTNHQLSNLMLWSNFLSCVFYSASYPYVYAETVKAVTNNYISFQQIVSCIGIALFGMLWNKFGDRFFNHYRLILLAETIADTFLFAHVLITGNLKFYFVLNVIIYSVITKNLSCGGVKMRAKVNPTDRERERYDNNSNTCSAIASLLGAALAIVTQPSLHTLFILALIGEVLDNFSTSTSMSVFANVLKSRKGKKSSTIKLGADNFKHVTYQQKNFVN